MNTVIADLMEQAFDRCKKYDDEDNTGLVKTTEAFAIFAELIVKHCIDTLNDLHVWQTINNHEYPSGWHEGVECAIDHLIVHWELE